ncbi:MAG: beta-propeller fold lactonase family protein, partial [Steroidobacter sp.]
MRGRNLLRCLLPAVVGMMALETFAQAPRYAYSLDAGERSVSVYSVDANTGMLRRRGHRLAWGLPNEGVRDPSERFFYVVTDSPAAVSAFTIDAASGDLTEIDGSPFLTGTSNDERGTRVTIHPTGRFLYVVTHSPAAVSAFTLDAASGEVTEIDGRTFLTATSTDERGTRVTIH